MKKLKKQHFLLIFCKSESLLCDTVDTFVFADADQYELQAASVSSPMKSPHRYSPSVYSHQVPHSTAHTLATTANSGLPLEPSLSRCMKILL